MNELENKKFYNSTWFCVSMLILICPVGVVLMWKNEIFNKAIKIIISVIAIPITLLGLLIWISIISPSTNNDLQKKSDEAVQKRNAEATQSAKGETNEIKKENKTEAIEENKEIKEDKAPKDKETIKSYSDSYKAADEVALSQLYRNPDKYKGKTLKIKAIVNQVLQDAEYETLIASDEITEEKIALQYKRKEGQIRYLENDYICALVDFKGMEIFSTLIGENKQIPVGTIKEIYLADVSEAIINVSEAVANIKADYKVIYEDKSAYISKLNKKVYFFKVYDNTNKCYKEEFLVSDGSNAYWYNEKTVKLSESIYQRKYQ